MQGEGAGAPSPCRKQIRALCGGAVCAVPGFVSWYSCDNWNFNASNPVVYGGGSYSQSGSHGLFCVSYTGVSNASADHGSRILLVSANPPRHYDAACTGSRAPLGEDKQLGSGLVHPIRSDGTSVLLKGGNIPIPKRVGNLFKKIVSDENLSLAIKEVNATHRFHGHHKPNRCTAWVEETKEDRAKDLRAIIEAGFEPQPPRTKTRWDASARKWRDINEPVQWPDQYVHHALIQVLQPIFMRGMDPYCCGSIRGRGARHGKEAIERWMEKDQKGTKYEFSGDIYHFYNSLKPDVVMDRMRNLIKDRRVLDLVWRIIKDGVLIGYYPSQWFANTTLQPLDQLIRQSGFCSHYVRYMDNLTVFGPNKRKLKKLRYIIDGWLNDHGLRLKGDWQIFRTAGRTKKKQLNPPRNGCERQKSRIPDAMGYRYGRGYTIPRKHNFLRTKRAVSRYRKRRDAGKRISPRQANSIISRCGQLKHCNNVNLYKILFRGERVLRECKNIIRASRRKEITWSMYLEQRAILKSSRSSQTMLQA